MQKRSVRNVRKRSVGAVAAFVTAAFGLGGSAGADVTARVEGPALPVAVGQAFDVTILADISDPVLGWGLDLGFDPGLLQLTTGPSIGPDWTAFPSADGDGLSGVFLPGPGGVGHSGDALVLATLSFQAVASGVATLMLGTTLSDLGEGFALDPTGFDANVSFVDGIVTIIPEPGTAWLLGLGLALLARPGRRGARLLD